MLKDSKSSQGEIAKGLAFKPVNHIIFGGPGKDRRGTKICSK